ncbi:serine-rich adhesin for platelets [Culex pipiens pallens]|uniref:serine-rich adhesin for platelets n=1 Tax=Culex pipiens pallens TaxID=42434 RepID=UPI001953E2A1|nr:serine-rich adhesin for platelets [Culex pipiens pallens]
MDRSVDSIGSCSLDVDADSTDFSDTSGELNFLTPNSAKDIQREFTAGIKERCKIPVINCQAVTTVLDPVTGNISTVLTTTSPQAADTATTEATADGALPNKKPSYLNLACCVNGYSNLTTYDSKLRQDINKSREVSPSRPIIATLHYNRSSDGGNFQLTAPTLSYISMNNSINNNLSNGTRMVNGRNGAPVNGTAGQDVTDNVSVNAAAAMFNGNGFGGGGLRTKVISSQSQISSVRESERVVKKSFIQQRVEKLYGNAEGVVINKQIYSNNSSATNERKYLNNIANENVASNKNCYTTPASVVHHLNGNGTTNGSATNNGGLGGGVVTKENLDVNGKEFGGDPDMEALPVMRHLRPEFRAQLQMYSPKKVPKTSPGRFSNGSSAGSLNGVGANNNNHIASNGDLSHHHHSHLSQQHLTNGSKLTTNGTTTATSSLLSSSIFSSSTSVATVVESSSKNITTTTSKSSSSSSSSSSSYQTEASSALSATTNSVTTNNANACDATGPTTAPRESPSTIAAAAELVEAQASVEKEAATIGAEPSIPVQQQQQEVSSLTSKMKLSEPCVNGGDGVDNVAIIRNGSSSAASLIKNGHHCRGDVDHGEDDKENINGGGVIPEVLPKVAAASLPVVVKDGNHFLQVMKNEQNRLLAMAADIEREAEQCKTDGVEISEEVAGYVLVAAGKARLLCSQKMKQFEGLCHTNLNQIPGEKFQTTNEDLQGFWDMVMLQVNDVDASFVEIESFRRNGWKKPAPVSPVPQARSTARSTKLTKRPFKAPASSSSNGSADVAEAKKAAAEKREAARKQLMELKRKQKLASAQQNVEIFVPGSNNSSSVEVSNGVATS